MEARGTPAIAEVRGLAVRDHHPGAVPESDRHRAEVRLLNGLVGGGDDRRGQRRGLGYTYHDFRRGPPGGGRPGRASVRGNSIPFDTAAVHGGHPAPI